MTASAVVGRHEELESVRVFLEESGGPTRAVTLFGEPGMGKTTVWEAGLELAGSLGYATLAHRSAEAEAGFAFTGLADLVGPQLAAVSSELAPPRRRALEVALLLGDPADDPPDPRAIGLAFLDVLRLLSDAGPVLVAIDDLQWLDSSSSIVLPLAIRRLGAEPVKLLTTLRSAPGIRAPFDLVPALGPRGLRELRLAPLRLGDLHHLLSRRLGLELSRPELARILEASGGNPFFALELARRGADPDDAPGSLRDALSDQLAHLPPTTRATLEAVAALARPTTELVAALADDPDAALASLDVAAREKVVVVDPPRVRFTHPVLASLCYEAMPTRRRREVHARLADVLPDVEQRARHRALAGVGADPALAAELEVASRHAASRGATAAAAELAELAADRTPTDDPQRQLRRLSAGGLHHLSGDFAKATALYTSLEGEMPSGPLRADVLYARAIVGLEDMPTRIGLCERALEEAADDDARCAQFHGLIALGRWILGDLPRGLKSARDGLERAERAGDARVLAVALGRVGILETWALDVTPGLLERGVALEQGLASPSWFNDSPAFMLTQRLYETDELDRSRSMLEEMERRAQERGDEHTRQWVVLQLLIVEWYAGRCGRALQHAAVAREIAAQTGEPQYGGMVASVTSRVEADIGLLDEARRTAQEGIRLSQSVSDEIFTVGNLASLGHAYLVSGDLEAAAACLRDLPERQWRTGHLSSLIGSSGDGIEALIGVGAVDDAERLLRGYETVAERANRWSRLGAARCAGLLAAARGEHSAAVRTLERGLAEHGGPPMYALERGRTLLALGVARRLSLQRRAAREALDEALAVFEELGAVPWVERARDELGRISGRRSPRDELTDAETPRRDAGSGGAAEPRDRSGAVSERQHGRGAPLAYLPQARRSVTSGARGPVRAVNPGCLTSAAERGPRALVARHELRQAQVRVAGRDRLQVVHDQPAELGMVDGLGADLRVEHLVARPQLAEASALACSSAAMSAANAGSSYRRACSARKRARVLRPVASQLGTWSPGSVNSHQRRLRLPSGAHDGEPSMRVAPRFQASTSVRGPRR